MRYNSVIFKIPILKNNDEILILVSEYVNILFNAATVNELFVLFSGYPITGH